MIRDDTVPSSW